MVFSVGGEAKTALPMLAPFFHQECDGVLIAQSFQLGLVVISHLHQRVVNAEALGQSFLVLDAMLDGLGLLQVTLRRPAERGRVVPFQGGAAEVEIDPAGEDARLDEHCVFLVDQLPAVRAERGEDVLIGLVQLFKGQVLVLVQGHLAEVVQAGRSIVEDDQRTVAQDAACLNICRMEVVRIVHIPRLDGEGDGQVQGWRQLRHPDGHLPLVRPSVPGVAILGQRGLFAPDHHAGPVQQNIRARKVQQAQYCVLHGDNDLFPVLAQQLHRAVQRPGIEPFQAVMVQHRRGVDPLPGALDAVVLAELVGEHGPGQGVDVDALRLHRSDDRWKVQKVVVIIDQQHGADRKRFIGVRRNLCRP